MPSVCGEAAGAGSSSETEGIAEREKDERSQEDQAEVNG
jgi:hypothetical protein